MFLEVCLRASRNFAQLTQPIWDTKVNTNTDNVYAEIWLTAQGKAAHIALIYSHHCFEYVLRHTLHSTFRSIFLHFVTREFYAVFNVILAVVKKTTNLPVSQPEVVSRLIMLRFKYSAHALAYFKITQITHTVLLQSPLISSRGGAPGLNLLYSPLEEEGASCISSNLT
jgi:hypothetical protein